MTTDPMNPDDLQERVGAALHGHLDRVAASADLTGPAIRRSRTIRRNRAIGTSAVAAVAVLAVATPIAWSSLRQDRTTVVPATTSSTSVPSPTSSSTPAPSASTSTGAATTLPAPGPSTTSSATGGTAPVVTRDNSRAPRRTVTVGPTLPAGAAPDLVWRLDDTLHSGSGSVRLDVPDRWSWTPLTATTGVVVPDAWATGGPVRVVGTDGSTVATALTVPAKQVAEVVAAADGSRFAVLVHVPGDTGSGASLTVFDARGRQVAAKDGLLHAVELGGFVGDRVLLGNRTVGRSYAWDLPSNVIERWTDTGVVQATDDGHGLAVLWTPGPGDTSGCTEVVDATKAQPVTVARSCGEFVPAHFSPDGSRLVGYPVGTDGAAAAITDVLDIESGRIVLRLKGAGFTDTMILPNGDLALNVLLGVGRQGASNVLATCTPTGTCTRFTEPLPIDMDTARYGLPR